MKTKIHEVELSCRNQGNHKTLNFIEQETGHEEAPTISKVELYAIIVYGLVPELMPHRAFRRDKHYKKSDKKTIKCPYCCEILIEVEASAKLELLRYSYKVKTKVKCHKSMPCRKCNNLVGIIYAA